MTNETNKTACATDGSVYVNGLSNKIFTWEFYVNITYTLIVCYIAISQIIVFAVKRKYRPRTGLKNRKFYKNLSFIMNFTLVLSGLIAVSKMGITMSKYFVPFTPVVNITNIILGEYSFVTIYLILWLRQTMFTSEPSIKHLSTTAGRIFSKFQGFFIIIFSLVLAIALAYEGITKNALRLSCVPKWVVMAFLFLQVETQIAVLVLFLVPMYRHKNKLNKSANQAPPETLIALMKRSIIVTIIAVVSDITTFAVFFIVGEITLYNLNILINLICILFCFIDWRDRIFPFRIKRGRERLQSDLIRSSYTDNRDGTLKRTTALPESRSIIERYSCDLDHFRV